ncbi:unnamed protein product [Miscanthus lutarioriparius]|uniref:Myb/SANT-like domain-containing protein n=1 Tax=Miscanthus lutarioriparius TaxID=422564 RepID=A0A811NFM2_9POAL|nr:unnamed protein product [Miscanthus lutarioriparius]
MASAPVDVLHVEGGFVAATEVMAEVVGAKATPAADVAAAAAPAAGPMRWNNNTSRFVLRMMAQLLSDGTRPNKVFKDKDVNLIAKCLKDYSGDAVSPTQVYNHPRKWRQKWSRIYKLKDLSGAIWDSDVNAIMLDGENYLGHCKDHPKDAEFLNYPIRFYSKMEVTFGHSMATDSAAAKVEGSAFHHVPEEKTNTEVGEGSKAIEQQHSTVGGKRKRRNFTEDEMLLLTNMSDVVNNVANALRETGATHVDPDLYLAVMEMQGFTTEALIVAYTYLLENKAIAIGFVKMAISHRDIWLRNYLAKNYYM